MDLSEKFFRIISFIGIPLSFIHFIYEGNDILFDIYVLAILCCLAYMNGYFRAMAIKNKQIEKMDKSWQDTYKFVLDQANKKIEEIQNQKDDDDDGDEWKSKCGY